MKRKTKKRLERIGFRVRALRRLKNMNQAELAKKTGISQGLISKVERNGSLRSIEDFAALLEALDIPLDRFLKGIYEETNKRRRLS